MSESRWEPSQEEVEREYSRIESAYLKSELRKVPLDYESWMMEFAKIAAFLNDTNAVLVQLKKLNALLVEEARKRNLSIDSIKLNGPVYLKHNKLLRNLLERELEKLGFQPDLAKALDYISPEIFRLIIREGILIKDPAVGKDHGEFTHAIQWVIIGLQQNDTHFLNKSVIDVFKELGSDRSVIDGKGNNEKNLWDLLVDKNFSYDCGCPEHLHNLINQSGITELSLLRILCLSRVAKRYLSSTLFLSLHDPLNGTYPKKEYIKSVYDKNLLIARTRSI